MPIEYEKPVIKLYVIGNEITFRVGYSRLIRDIAAGLQHRRWDPGKKQWFIYPPSYEEFKKKLFKANYRIITTPAVRKLVELYPRVMTRRIQLKQLDKIDYDINQYIRDEIELRRYQKVASNFIYRGKRAILGDPVGVGKTPMAITAMSMALHEGKTEFFLVIVPGNLRLKWKKEIEKFIDFEPVLLKFSKNRIKTYEDIFTSERRDRLILINSYASFARDVYVTKKIKTKNRTVKKKIVRKDGLLPLLKKYDVNFGMIFDEIQKCKNYSSTRSQASFRVANLAKHVYGLSATYTEGRLEELYNVFRVVQPHVLGTFDSFQQKYFVLSPFNEIEGYKNLNDVKSIIAPYVIRRRIEDIDVEMPNEVYQEYWISLTSQQRGLYRSLVEEHLTRARAGGNIPLQMLAERKCCLSTELLDEDIKDAPKINALKEIIDSLEPGAKAVVFSFFGVNVPIIDIIVRELSEDPDLNLKGNIYVAKGSMTDADIAKQVKEFEEPADNEFDKKVLITTDVLKEGHDINTARHIINFDLLWNPASMRQRAGRLIRFTQVHKSIVVHTIITNNTVEDYMWNKVLLPKKALMKNIMDGDKEEYRVTKKEAIYILENFKG